MPLDAHRDDARIRAYLAARGYAEERITQVTESFTAEPWRYCAILRAVEAEQATESATIRRINHP
jgi:SOS response regulatory protein OraA/RecX